MFVLFVFASVCLSVWSKSNLYSETWGGGRIHRTSPPLPLHCLMGGERTHAWMFKDSPASLLSHCSLPRLYKYVYNKWSQLIRFVVKKNIKKIKKKGENGRGRRGRRDSDPPLLSPCIIRVWVEEPAKRLTRKGMRREERTLLLLLLVGKAESREASFSLATQTKTRRKEEENR